MKPKAKYEDNFAAVAKKKITDQFDNQADVVKKAKSGGARKLQKFEVDAIWDEVQAERARTFKWVQQKLEQTA